MSFRCENAKCGKVEAKPNRVVTKTRTVDHIESRPGKYPDDPPRRVVVGRGKQIVAEKNVCSSCVPA